MKGIFKKFENAMAAAAFAEAGEVETAREILNENKPRKTMRPAEYRRVRQTSRKSLRAD